ncbi:MAG: hypothetical protein GY696_01680 [Gammaproteobacteria bacterium]|nr:hypothetical protein [Gammaproteobacteria bacterium]
MNSNLNRRLHMGCGESLKTLLPGSQQSAAKPVVKRKESTPRTVQGTKRRVQ